ncbi:MAG: Gfo/Idh/MocA family oxidoreductase [Pseudomonadota bacterium]
MKSNEPSKPARRLRLGMVGGGPGAFVGAIHRFAARLDDDYELVAAALSADAQRNMDGGLDLHIAPDRVYADYTEMAHWEAARADGIDVVSIVVPNHLHFAVARAFLEVGIHVICDKPLTTSLADGLRLRDLARRKECLFALTHNYSGYPMVRAARDLVAAGTLGEIRIIQVEYAQEWLAEPVEQRGNRQAQWRTDPARAGPAGCLGDIGTHAAHLAEYVSGMAPAQVSADLCSFVPGRRLDDHVQIQLRYATGARGLLWASQVAIGDENKLQLRIYGALGAIRWQQESADVLWHSPLGGAARRLTRGTPGVSDAARAAGRLPAGHPEGYIEAFAQLYRDFAVALRTQRPSDPVPDLDAGIRSLCLVEAALASHRADSAWTAVPDGDTHQLRKDTYAK